MSKLHGVELLRCIEARKHGQGPQAKAIRVTVKLPHNTLNNSGLVGAIMSRIDYSKWDHIEISDDEDDTHPNVDTASLFKWRHEARVQRNEEKKKERAKKEAEKKIRAQQIDMLRARKAKLEEEGTLDAKEQLEKVNAELEKLEQYHKDYLKKEAELERFEREHPTWDVDNISKEKHDRTIINPSKKEAPKKEETEEEKVETMSEWFKKNGKKAQKFAHISKQADAHKFLAENLSLVCEHLASYLVIYCVDLAVDPETEADVPVCARQTIMIQYILELAKTLKRDPRECVNAFFARLATADPQYKAAFDDEVAALIARVKKRAQERVAEAQEEMKKQRLGPGGLDPYEVLDSLPAKIKEAFETQNTPMLKEGFAELSPEDAAYHYKRVVDSGLWVPAPGSDLTDAKGDGDDDGADDDGADADDEEEAEADEKTTKDN